MNQSNKAYSGVGLGTRKLDKGDRIARYARNNVWNQVIIFIRRKGMALFVLFLIPLLSSLPLAILMKGITRWIFVGAMGATAFWLVVNFIILWSGVAPSIMGIEGEGLTADTLNRFGRGGWYLINGMRFPNKGDIDHILIGPSGVLIFETKWSGSRWPMKGEYKRYISGQLDWAMKQATLNRVDVKGEFKSIPKELELHAICVLWSAQDSSEDSAWFYNQNTGTWCIRGPELERWLGELRKGVLDNTTVKSIHSEMKEFVWRRDEEDLEKDGPHRRTIDRFMSESIFLPAAAFLAPAFVIFAISLFKNLLVDVGGLVVLVTVGIVICHKTRLKLVVISWFAGLLTTCGYLLVYVVRALSH